MARPDLHSQVHRKRYRWTVSYSLPFYLPTTPTSVDRTLTGIPTWNQQRFMSLNPQALEYIPQQAHLPIHVSPEGVDFTYEPQFLGQSTNTTASESQADSQHPEPFWYQYPSWTRNKLYYDPQAAFIEHHLDEKSAMDGTITYIGRGTKEGKKIDVTYAPHHRRRYDEMVEVYIGDEFVQKMPLRLLKRFSGVAKQEFSVNSDDTQSSAADSKPNETEEVKKPKSTPAASSEPKTWELALHLYDVDPADYPRANFVQQALNWMKSNEREAKIDKLIIYGPSEPGNFDILQLLEIYQVAVALDIQPTRTTNSLRTELKERVTHALPEDVELLLRDVTQYLPVDDSVTVRAITAAWDRWNDGAFTADEWLGIKGFLLDPNNEALAKKAQGIFHHRTKGRNKRLAGERKGKRDRAAEAHQEGWRKLAECSGK